MAKSIETHRMRAPIIGAASIAVIATIALLTRDTPPPATPEAPQGANAPARGATASASLSVVPDPAAEQIPGAHCWEGLLDVDRDASIATLKDVLARAVASGDELLAAFAGDRLVEVIGGSVERAAELLDYLATTSGREAEIGFAALARTEAVRDPAIARRLMGIGEDRAADPVVRASAIGALETQTRLGGDDLRRVLTVALDPDAVGVAWTATRTIGRVMKEDFTRTGEYAPYMNHLLEISKRTAEPGVRLLALEMPAYVDPILGTEYIDELAALLRTSPERELREIAAFQLGLTKDPQRVLDVFRSAFPHEPELCVRWAMVRFAVRAAGQRALPLLAELARLDPRFAVDVEDFRKIYATGLRDFERVWLDKTEHHACVTEAEGES